MKKLILLLSIVIAITACTDKKKQLIADFEQTTGNVKTDLGFKVKSLKLSKKVTALDSLRIAFGDANEADYMNRIDSMADVLIQIKIKREHQIDSLRLVSEKEPAYLKVHYDELIDSFEESLELYEELISEKEPQRAYAENPKKVLANIWTCTYTVKNPMMNNVKQEITKDYVFNADNTELLRVLEEGEK